MNSRRVIACLAFVATSAIAGMYDQPYALVEAGDPNQARDEFRPAITKLDGKSMRNPRKSDPIEPGKHRITVRFETARVTQSPAEAMRELEMDLEACTRYFIVAKRIKGTTNWEPKVYPETIGECKKKFDKNK
jgi:hypothetical protein